MNKVVFHMDFTGSLSVAVVYNEMVTDAVDDDAFDIEVTE